MHTCYTTVTAASMTGWFLGVCLELLPSSCRNEILAFFCIPACTRVCTCPHTCTCVQRYMVDVSLYCSPQCSLLDSPPFVLFLSYSLTRAGAHSFSQTGWLSMEPSGPSCLVYSMLKGQKHATMPGLPHGCWRSKWGLCAHTGSAVPTEPSP